MRRVFIGLENINPENLIAAKKRQNKITEYRVMLQKWRDHGAITYAGYILGFPADTKESILRDIEIIKRELPLDILEFFFLTPLPGSEDHKVLLAKGVWMDRDINKYDLNHRVVASFQDVGRGVGGRLSSRLGRLLHARAHPHDLAAQRREPERPAEADAEHDPVVPADDRTTRACTRSKAAPSGSNTVATAGAACKLENPLVFYPRYCRRDRSSRLWRYWRYLPQAQAILNEVLTAPDR